MVEIFLYYSYSHLQLFKTQPFLLKIEIRFHSSRSKPNFTQYTYLFLSDPLSLDLSLSLCYPMDFTNYRIAKL